MSIGENIRYYRKQNKLTMKELGNLLGVSEQAIGNYERGDRTPDIIKVEQIASALNCNITDLLGYKYTPEDIALLDGTGEHVAELKKFLEMLEYFGYEIRDNGDKYKILKSDTIDLDLPHDEINDFSKKVSEALSDFLEITLKHIIR